MSDHKLTPWERRCLEYVEPFKNGSPSNDPTLHELMVLGGALHKKEDKARRLNSILKLEHFKLLRSYTGETDSGFPVGRFQITVNGEFYAKRVDSPIGRDGGAARDAEDFSPERHEQTSLPLSDDPPSHRAGSGHASTD